MTKRVLIIALLAGLLGLAIPVAQAAGCVFYDSDVDGDEYLDFRGGNTLQGGYNVYSDSNCQTVDRYARSDAGKVYTSSSERAWSLCSTINDKPIRTVRQVHHGDNNLYHCIVHEREERPQTVNQTLGSISTIGREGEGTPMSICRSYWPTTNYVLEFFPRNWRCFYTWTSGSGSSRRGTVYDTGNEHADPVAPPQLPLTGLRIHAFDGMDGGIQFRRLTHYGVGNREVIDLGFRDAVDIWGNIGSGYEVCFPQIGSIGFLDAATSPRSLIFPDYSLDDGWTCASLNIAGTMVLVNAPAGADAQTSTSTTRSGTDDSIEGAIALENCTVTPHVNLNLRAAPWGEILDTIPRGTQVPAKARTQSWFHVRYADRDGWSAAWLTASDGYCDWTE